MSFIQAPPTLGNTYESDLLRALTKVGGLAPVEREVSRCLAGAGRTLGSAARSVSEAVGHAAARFARFPLDSIRDDAPLEEARALLGAAEPIPAGRER